METEIECLTCDKFMPDPLVSIGVLLSIVVIVGFILWWVKSKHEKAPQ